MGSPSAAIEPVVERHPVAPGVELAARRWRPADPAGSGPPFLLVHGLASNARTWDGVGTALAAAGREAVAIDLRGHGRSSKPDVGYDVTTVALDLAAAIDRLGLERPVVAGQSWGGNVVLELGARAPGRLRGVVGVDGGLIELRRRFGDWEACARELAPPRLAGRPLVELERRIRAWHPDWPESGIAGTLANFEVRPDGTIAPWLTFERHLTVLRGLWEHDPTALLRDYPLPLLIAIADGGDDRASEKRASVERARALLPGLRVAAFPGADHDIHAQRPAELASLLLAFPSEGPER